MNAVQMSAAHKLDGLKKARAFQVLKLKGLKNISWLTTRQLNKLAGALSVIGVERRGQIFDERDTSDRVHVLLSGVARITCRNRKGRRAVVIMRHKDLAELAGASRPRVSEHLTEFEDKHLITRRKRQVIVNRDRLESFLSVSDSHVNGDSSWAA